MIYWRPSIPLNIAPSLQAIGGEVDIGPALLVSELLVSELLLSELEVRALVVVLDVVVIVAVVIACIGSDVETAGLDVDAGCIELDDEPSTIVADAGCIDCDVEINKEELAVTCSDLVVKVVAILDVVVCPDPPNLAAYIVPGELVKRIGGEMRLQTPSSKDIAAHDSSELHALIQSAKLVENIVRYEPVEETSQ